ncbi:hypothetical protein [Clostridium beijerinckii]|uniref:hypothetical protein n=1 Tax=Clostridium beijerinckii TaxID=1520 RepID=UPI0015CD619C|nr:hypothetical protein [Clostridium beijerinckii]NOW06145.1 hypothetical protein [Clostridium beijerinckii]NYC00711.1 hypothetical protein [Clostridium beijerinckii]
MIKLYRPVGLKEMELILNSNSREFPARLPTQPIFYPVLEYEYASQIASDWNTVDNNSGLVGYVTEFNIDEDYISQFKVHTVGKSIHRELWIPSNKLKEFNNNIIGKILISEAFYGKGYIGIAPEPTILKNTGVKDQILLLNRILNYSGMDFRCEVALQWKTILLNIIYWHKLDLTKDGIDEESKLLLLTKIYNVLKQNGKQLIVNSYRWTMLTDCAC